MGGLRKFRWLAIVGLGTVVAVMSVLELTRRSHAIIATATRATRMVFSTRVFVEDGR
jgi:hypothetical protein